MNLEDIVRKYVEENYDLIDARSKVAQDIILSKISKSRFIVYLILFVELLVI